MGLFRRNTDAPRPVQQRPKIIPTDEAKNIQRSQLELPTSCQLEPELKKYLAYPRPSLQAVSAPISAISRKAPNYEVFSQSVIGQRHINEGTDKEDNCLIHRDETSGVWAFALGDGHGDPNCSRSKIGSMLVSQIAIEQLVKLEDGLRSEGRSKLLLQKNQQEKLLRKLILSIKVSWDQAIYRDLQAAPLTEAELAQCEEYGDSYRRGEALEHLYGTTLIAGLATKEYLILLQQGDGRCDVFHADGSVDQPIPWDDDCVGNATTSMCQPDTWKRCRYCVIDLYKDPVIACFAGSDGVEDSFRSMEDVHTYYREMLLYSLDHGVDALVEYLETELTRLNQVGSMDDTTVVGIIDTRAAELLHRIYRKQNEACRLLNIYDRADEALMSKEGRKDFLKQKFEEIEQRYGALQKQRAEITQFHHAEKFYSKMGCIDLASQEISGEEYKAVSDILESWLNSKEQFRGKWDEYFTVQNEYDKRRNEYLDYLEKYVNLQREKALAARDIEALFAERPDL